MSEKSPARNGPSTGLPQLTGFLLRRAYARAADCAQACISNDDTQVRDVVHLALLDERGAMSQRQLAEITHVNPTTMVKLVDSLEERGWVARERNPEDRRSYALRLTELGEKALSSLRHELDDAERILTGTLTSSQRDRLRRHLRALLHGEVWMVVDSLAGHNGFLIAQAHRQVRGWAVDALAPLGLDPRDFGVLSTVGREQPCSQSQLAQALGVSPPAALSFVDELEEADLVRRERNAADRRYYDLTLTPAGKRRLAQARKAAAKVQARIVDRLGAESDAELQRLLTSVIAAK
jgi:DNA-binding MarR family transcriptional regulator